MVVQLVTYQKWRPQVTTMAIRMMLNKPIGIRYFHSKASIWSIRTRGNVHLNQIITNEMKNALPRNHTIDGIKSITALKPSHPGM